MADLDICCAGCLMVAIAPVKVRYRDAAQTNTYHAVVVVIRVVLA